MKSNDDWRGSTGTLWNKQKKPPDILSPSGRPVSATPPDTVEDTPKSRRKGGLRKKFRSLTEGLSNLFTGDKRDSSAKRDYNSPLRLRKSVFYVDHGFARDTPVTDVNDETKYAKMNGDTSETIRLSHYRIIPSPDCIHEPLSNPLVYPRLTRSMSQGTGSGSCKKPVRAPPSPPPRRYTLWGLNPPHNDMKREVRAFDSSIANPYACDIYNSHLSQYGSMYPPTATFIPPSPLILTPPSSPLNFRSTYSWGCHHPSIMGGYHTDDMTTNEAAHGTYKSRPTPLNNNVSLENGLGYSQRSSSVRDTGCQTSRSSTVNCVYTPASPIIDNSARRSRYSPRASKQTSVSPYPNRKSSPLCNRSSGAQRKNRHVIRGIYHQQQYGKKGS